MATTVSDRLRPCAELLKSTRVLVKEDCERLEVAASLPYLAQGHVRVVGRATGTARSEWGGVADDTAAFFVGHEPGPGWGTAVRELLLEMCYQLQDRASFDLVGHRFREWVTPAAAVLGLARLVAALASSPVALILKLVSDKVALQVVAPVRHAVPALTWSDRPGTWRVVLHFVTHEIVTVTMTRALMGAGSGEECECEWQAVWQCERPDPARGGGGSGNSLEKHKGAMKFKGANVLRTLEATLDTAPAPAADAEEYQVEVLHAHTPGCETELGLQPGSLVTVLLKHPSGWWRGRAADGSVGWLPAHKTRPTASTLERIKAKARLKYNQSEAQARSPRSAEEAKKSPRGVEDPKRSPRGASDKTPAPGPKLKAGERGWGLWREGDAWYPIVVKELVGERFKVMFPCAGVEQLSSKHEVSVMCPLEAGVEMGEEHPDGLPTQTPPQADAPVGARGGSRRNSVMLKRDAPGPLRVAAVQVGLLDTNAKAKTAKAVADALCATVEGDGTVDWADLKRPATWNGQY